MKTRSLNTGPPRRPKKVNAAGSNRGINQSRYQPGPDRSDNLQIPLFRQVRGPRQREEVVSRKLSSAVATRPSSELERLLSVLKRRLDAYRTKVLSLAAIKGALETELARRAACYGPEPKTNLVML